MKIKIKEDGRIEELSIIDPKSNVDWVKDFMGNHDALPEYNEDEDVYEMQNDDYKWWSDVTTSYETADIRYREMLSEINDQNERDKFAQAVMDACACDLESQPAAMQKAMDEWQAS